MDLPQTDEINAEQIIKAQDLFQETVSRDKPSFPLFTNLMSKVKSTELYFLVLHWLKSTPCQEAATVLERELELHRLLPTVPTLTAQSNIQYEALSKIFSHVPSSALPELIEECINQQIEAHGNQLNHTISTKETVSVLEATGSYSFIPSVRRRLTPSTVIVPPPSCKPNFIQLLYQREFLGSISSNRLAENLTRKIYSQLHHVKTLRGHRKAVYCVALDRPGKYVLTGADDGLIKIWDARFGLLLITCRGHVGEITDLKINSDDSLFASSSNDATCRVWSLDKARLGEHLCALMGHEEPITFLSFNPKLRTALLSVSLDGTCRLWEAESGIEVIRLKPVGSFGHFYNINAFDKPVHLAKQIQRESPFVLDRAETDVGLICCAFSPTGEHFSVSSRSGKCFLWHWDISQFPCEEDPTMTWPDVCSFVELLGHQKDVPLVCFNHLGNGLFTSSSEGSLKVWKPLKSNKRLSTLKAGYWQEQWSLALPDPLPCPMYNNRRKKQTPECNQIAWSCDDQYLLAAFSCAVIMVWNSMTGVEESILYGGHTDTPVHVLETHPTDRKLCFSAGYDGMLILWDIVAGHKLKELSSQDTHPGRWRWADPLQFVDGRFSDDGMSIVVSDVAGQVHFYALDNPSEVMERTPYDQFFLYDYDRVIIGEQGQPIDVESGEPQHIHRTRFSMVDMMGMPYDPEIQEILIETKDYDMLPKAENPPRTPPALLEIPPTVTATLWLANELGLGQQATSTRVQAAQQRQITLMQESGPDDELAELLPNAVPEEDLPEMEIEIEEESDGSEYTPNEAEPETSPTATRRSERIQTRSFEMEQPVRGRRIPTRQHPEVNEVEAFDEDEEEDDDEEEEEEEEDEEIEIEEEEEFVEWPSEEEEYIETEVELESDDSDEIRSSSIATPISHRVSRRARRRQVFVSSDSASNSRSRRRTRRRQYRNRNRRRRRLPDQTLTPPEESRSSNQNLGREYRIYQWLSETRRPRGYYVPQVGDRVVFLSKVYHTFCEENEMIGGIMDRSLSQELRFAEPCEVTDVSYEISKFGEMVTLARVGLKLEEPSGSSFNARLELLIPPPIFGHEEFLINYNVFIWSACHEWSVGQKCQVFYSGDAVEWWQGEIINDRLVEENTEVQQQQQQQQQQQDDDEEDDDDEQHNQNSSMWDCEQNYRRFTVQWDDANGMDPEMFSPWELITIHGNTSHSSETHQTGPGTLNHSDGGPSSMSSDGFHEGDEMDENICHCLLRILAEAVETPEAEHFRETLDPDTSFPLPDHQENRIFYNRVVPLPISLTTIQHRLQHPPYYTNVRSFMHDVETIVTNAELFTGPESSVSMQAQILKDFIFSQADIFPETATPSPTVSVPRRKRARRQQSTNDASADLPLTAIMDHAPSSDYQIRTRGMAKRERQMEDTSNRGRTRRRCTRLM